VYDDLAELAFEIICSASAVTQPDDVVWSVQYNCVWNDLFVGFREGKALEIVRFKLRRLLYDEVVELGKFPGYRGARVLGLLLNVMGLDLQTKRKAGTISQHCAPLARAVQTWVKHHFSQVLELWPEVADAVSTGKLSFDRERRRFVKAYLAFPGAEAPREYLELD
jgi:hypothetical protein